MSRERWIRPGGETFWRRNVLGRTDEGAKRPVTTKSAENKKRQWGLYNSEHFTADNEFIHSSPCAISVRTDRRKSAETFWLPIRHIIQAQYTAAGARRLCVVYTAVARRPPVHCSLSAADGMYGPTDNRLTRG